MRIKMSEDWLAVILALLLVILALAGGVTPEWMKF
jgi:hypothetical protein